MPLLLDEFDPPPKPVPLHGDLWAGNVCHTSKGGVIFDPAGYYGHGEADLGIARMFGGESPRGVRRARKLVAKPAHPCCL